MWIGEKTYEWGYIEWCDGRQFWIGKSFKIKTEEEHEKWSDIQSQSRQTVWEMTKKMNLEAEDKTKGDKTWSNWKSKWDWHKIKLENSYSRKKTEINNKEY